MPSTSQLNDRWEWVDHARGIGIVLVVYGHIARGLFGAGLPINKAFFLTEDTVIYSFHMPLFFVLAGLFVFHSLQRRGVVLFIANKIDVILYPYIFWSLAQGVVEVLLRSYTNHHLEWGTVLDLWVPRAQFWFLYSLMGMFVLSAITFGLLKQEQRFSFALLVMGTVFLLMPDIKGLWELQYMTPLIYFAMGCVIAALGLQWEKIIRDRIPLVFLALAFLIVEFFLCSLLGSSKYLLIPVRLAAACVGISLCLKIEKFTAGRFRNMIVSLGQASMFIYLTHVIFASGVRIILQKLFGVDNIIIHLFLGTLAGLMIPFYIFEIYGKKQWLRGLWMAPKIFSFETMAVAGQKIGGK